MEAVDYLLAGFNLLRWMVVMVLGIAIGIVDKKLHIRYQSLLSNRRFADKKKL